MTEGEIRQLIRNELKNFRTEIMMGFIISNETAQRSTVKRMALEGPLTKIRNVQPYGFSSRAPAGTEAVIVPVNGDATHLNMMGHFDKGKAELGDGESAQYDNFGNKLHMLQGKVNLLTENLNVISNKINLGSEGSSEPLLLGNIVKQLFSDMLELIATHDHFGNLGYPTGAPRTAANFEALKASPVDDGAILSDKAFTEK